MATRAARSRRQRTFLKPSFILTAKSAVERAADDAIVADRPVAVQAKPIEVDDERRRRACAVST